MYIHVYLVHIYIQVMHFWRVPMCTPSFIKYGFTNQDPIKQDRLANSQNRKMTKHQVNLLNSRIPLASGKLTVRP